MISCGEPGGMPGIAIRSLPGASRQARAGRSATAKHELPHGKPEAAAGWPALSGQRPSGSHQAPSPLANRQVFLDETDQFPIQPAEERRTDPMARLMERSSRHPATPVGPPVQEGENSIEFGLERALNAGEQEAEQGRQVEQALAGEVPGVWTSASETLST